MIKSTVSDCIILDLPKIENREGNISVVENFKNIPFPIKRVFYIYDIPGGKDRGAHAHKKCHQFIVALSGAFEVELDDGNLVKKVSLSRPYHGLYIPPGIWAAEKQFSSGSVCLVIASDLYDESDYIREYLNFKILKNDTSNGRG